MKNTTLDIEIKVGVFVTIGVAIAMLSIILLGGAKTLFISFEKYSSHFDNVNGLIPGAKVILNGIRVGRVEKVQFSNKTRDIRVDYVVEGKYSEWIKTDTAAEISTQGVLGDKYVSLTGGSVDAAVLDKGGIIQVKREGSGLGQILSNSGKLVKSLNSIAISLDKVLIEFQTNKRHKRVFEGLATTAENVSVVTDGLKTTVRSLNEILGKINNGTGSIGGLINDPALYDDLKALVGGANRNRVMRNLVRQTIRDSEESEKSEKK